MLLTLGYSLPQDALLLGMLRAQGCSLNRDTGYTGMLPLSGWWLPSMLPAFGYLLPQDAVHFGMLPAQGNSSSWGAVCLGMLSAEEYCLCWGWQLHRDPACLGMLPVLGY